MARAGSRAVALLLDLGVQLVLAVLLALVGGLVLALLPGADAATAEGLLTVGVVGVLVGYPTVAETFFRGRTVGKLALGLRVVRDDGGPVRLRHALIRSLVGVAVEWPGLVLPPVTWIACLATMTASPRGKRLGDLAAGTMVIHDRSPAAWGWVPGMPPPLAGWARTLDLTGMPDDLALAVRHFLARGRGLTEPARTRLGRSLAHEIATVTTPPAPPGAPGWAYLAAVLAERHRRSRERLARARAVSDALWPELVHHPTTTATGDPGYPAVPAQKTPADTAPTRTGPGPAVRSAAPPR